MIDENIAISTKKHFHVQTRKLSVQAKVQKS